MEIRTSQGEDKILEDIRQLEDYQVDRVGEVLKANLFFVSHDSTEKAAFLRTISLIKANSTKGLVIDCPQEEALKEGLELLHNDRPAIFLAAIPPVPDGIPFPFGPESGQRVTAEINPAVMAVCREMQAVFVDNYSLFAGSPRLLPGVHPGPEGYRAMARNWHEAMKPQIARLVRR
jgi:lysophospholipase L1-like esterase